MQVQLSQSNNYNVSFRSKLAKTEYIKGAFAVARYNEGPTFIKAIERILNDGKSDVVDLKIEHRSGSGLCSQMDLTVNGEVKDSIIYQNEITNAQTIQQALDAKTLLVRYAGLENFATARKPYGVVKNQLLELEKKIFN